MWRPFGAMGDKSEDENPLCGWQGEDIKATCFLDETGRGSTLYLTFLQGSLLHISQEA
jgi:hypothetical protein